MKLNDLRKIIREEVTKVVRKELVGFVKLLGEAQTAKPLKKKRTTKVDKSKIENAERAYWKEHYKIFPNDIPKRRGRPSKRKNK